MADLLRRPVSALMIALALLALAPAARPGAAAPLTTVTEINGPAGGELFGAAGLVLPNGNIVVGDMLYDDGAASDVGAVRLYDGATFELISTLKGGTADDQIGGNLILLSSGNFLVRSTGWDNGAAANAGAVTWCSAVSGCSGTVSAANSLVGTSAGDRVGLDINYLPNGNYVVRNLYWDNGAITDVGAVTWCSGLSGCAGAVSAANSLVGATANDLIGASGTLALANGNYVVRSPNWDNGAIVNAGAATWASGAVGIAGVVSTTNSLVGTSAGDRVGSGIDEVGGGNYAVVSPNWDNGAAADAGAVTWASGVSGLIGVVSAANSLIGAQGGDNAGSGGITVLTNGNYVVRSPNWDNGAAANAGAATWANGASGLIGVVSAANSLVGSTADDTIGTFVIALANGNYVVCSPYWDNGAIANAGAATWGDGATGSSGLISSANSLVGSTAGDQVSLNAIRPLTNGNYVVQTYRWDNGAISDAGAATWGDGDGGVSGVVSSANSLVGSSAGDQVGSSTHALSDGNYVVASPNWDNGAISDAGAATWGDGATGSSGVVSNANSLVGSSAVDIVGRTVLALAGGAYLVASQNWDNGALVDVGSVTWCPAGGCTGSVSAANSLVGAHAGDAIGSQEISLLDNGNYVILSPNWDNGAISDAGAVTWAAGASRSSGVISATNSLVGSSSGDKVGINRLIRFADSTAVVAVTSWDNGALADVGAVSWSDAGTALTGPIAAGTSSLGTGAMSGNGLQVLSYDVARRRLLIGWSSDNRVLVVDLGPLIRHTYLPMIKR